MLRVGRLVIGLAAIGVLATIAAAQTGIVPAPPYYAMSPGAAAGAGGQSPVQQQILENYRSQLLQTQREMLQQNPSGLGREQLEINNQLNLSNAAPPVTYGAAPAPARSPAPPAAYYATPPAADYAAPPATRHAARRAAPRHPTADPAPPR